MIIIFLHSEPQIIFLNIILGHSISIVAHILAVRNSRTFHVFFVYCSLFVAVYCNLHMNLCYVFYLMVYDIWFQVTMKPQYVDNIRKSVKGKVGDYLNAADERQVKDTLCDILELNQVLERDVSDLSGGELQRFAIAARAMKQADVYIFDEPSCYLDVKQRLKAAQVIRSLVQPKK